jgi:MFS family permease
MLFILFLVREEHTPPSEESRKGVAAGMRDFLAVPQIRWILVAVLLSQCGMMLINPQISLFVEELVRDPKDVNRMVGLVIAAPAFSSFLMAPLWGRWGDRRGHARMLALALGIAALVIPPASLATTVLHVFLIRFLMGGFTSALNPSTHAVVAHSVEEQRTAGAFSLLSSAQMLGACLGPFMSGPLAQSFGVRPLFPVTGVLLLGAAFAAFRAGRSGRPTGAGH